MVAEHFLMLNPEVYIPLYLTYQDQADSLRVPLKPAWRAFGQAIGRLAEHHRLFYHDATTDVRDLANPQDADYAVDGHLSDLGQTIIGNTLASQVLSDVPAFVQCNASVAARAAR